MHRKADLFDPFHLNPTPLNHPTLEMKVYTFISTQTPLTRTLQIDGNIQGRTLSQFTRMFTPVPSATYDKARCYHR
jgi:hypothetical protein